MLTFNYNGHTYGVYRSTYADNGYTYLCVWDDTEHEPYADITTNCGYNSINTIVLDNDFVACVPKDFQKMIIDRLTDGYIKDVPVGWCSLPKYYLNMSVLDDIKYIR